jgi:hypothetical protein
MHAVLERLVTPECTRAPIGATELRALRSDQCRVRVA